MTARLALLCVLALPGCANEVPDALEGPDDPVTAALAYVDDPTTRRRALEASVADFDTAYGDLRLAHYSLRGAALDVAVDPADDWDELAVFAPRVRRLVVRDAGGDVDLEEGEVASTDALVVGSSHEAWERAGADAFLRVPAQIDLALDVLRDRAEAEHFGLSVSAEGVVHGAVEVETPVGWVVALTCAACHSAERDGALVLGVPNDRFNLGAIVGAEWPVGTMDVTRDDVANPVRPSDLRPISHQARLHHTGNLANGRVARMVRVETLLLTQSGARSRPDRRMVAALSLYLDSLARTLPALDDDSHGAIVFASECARCHAGDWLSGGPVSVEVVGTDDRATALSSERSTLGYRAPSLRGVGDRRGLLHDGTAADLDALLGLAPSAHVGHAFGGDLDESSLRALSRFLRALD